MLRSRFLRRQAETCLRLAEKCSNDHHAERLRLMAAEYFFRIATETEDDRPRVPWRAYGRPLTSRPE